MIDSSRGTAATRRARAFPNRPVQLVVRLAPPAVLRDMPNGTAPCDTMGAALASRSVENRDWRRRRHDRARAVIASEPTECADDGQAPVNDSQRASVYQRCRLQRGGVRAVAAVLGEPPKSCVHPSVKATLVAEHGQLGKYPPGMPAGTGPARGGRSPHIGGECWKARTQIEMAPTFLRARSGR